MGMMTVITQMLLGQSASAVTACLFLCLLSVLVRESWMLNAAPSAWAFSLLLLSVIMVALVSLVQSPAFLGSNRKWLSAIVTAMVLALSACFYVENVLLFYIFFEVSALLVFFFVLSFGYQPERYQAGTYLLIFTALSSLPFIGGALTLGSEFSLLSFASLGPGSLHYRTSLSGLISAAMLLGFLVKFPLYLFHIWLPKAHVEASSSGSMILAGVLLKLGAYGMLRLSLYASANLFNHFVLFFGLMGGALLSVVCCRAVDFKVMIAYSSVAHMSLVVGGLLTCSRLGESGSLMMSLGHGVTSSALFFGAGLYYGTTGSRLFVFNQGTAQILPWFSFFWFFFCASNMGTPPTINFWSELMLLFSLVAFSPTALIFLGSMLFFGVAFNVLLYLLSHGEKSSYYPAAAPWLSQKDYMLLMSHLVMSAFLVFSVNFK